MWINTCRGDSTWLCFVRHHFGKHRANMVTAAECSPSQQELVGRFTVLSERIQAVEAAAALFVRLQQLNSRIDAAERALSQVSLPAVRR